MSHNLGKKSIETNLRLGYYYFAARKKVLMNMNNQAWFSGEIISWDFPQVTLNKAPLTGEITFPTCILSIRIVIRKMKNKKVVSIFMHNCVTKH